ncbi:MAG: hypothetical protein AABW56_01310 [Nanoarchaeota archaeon]
MGLEELLARPKVSELVKDHKVIQEYFNPGSNTVRFYISYLLDRLKPNEILLFGREYPIIPRTSLNAIHKLGVIKLKRYDSLENAIKDKATPESNFIHGLNKLDFRSIIGWDWQGIMHTSREYRVVPFTEIYQAQMMNSDQDFNHKINVNPYIGNLGELKVVLEMALKSGGQADVNVPSVNETGSYGFRLYNIPLVKSTNLLSYNWFNLNWDHVCKEQEFYPLHYGRHDRGKLRTGNEKFADAHVISAFEKLKKEINRGNYGAYLTEDPFFNLTKYGLNIMRKMRTQVVKEEFYHSKKGRKLKKRMLNNGEINVLFGDLLLYNLDLKKNMRNPGKLVFTKFFGK